MPSGRYDMRNDVVQWKYGNDGKQEGRESTPSVDGWEEAYQTKAYEV